MSTATARVRVNGPVEGDLALLWGLAQRKFEARTGVGPATREDWQAITREYQALTAKQRVALGTRLVERCVDGPAQAGGT